MKTTININVGGMAFVIDNDAYNELTKYLTTLENHFKPQEGGEEIIQDIEYRMAELFKSYLSDHEVLTTTDVKNAIEVMGTPDDFDIPESSDQTTTSNASTKVKKKLYRDTEDGVIGGVCAGIANYLNTDVVWIRLALVLFTFFGGSGILIYIIMYFVVPEAKTTAEKLAMKGESVDINSIEKKIREEAEKVGARINNPQTKDKIKSGADKIFYILSRLIRAFLKLVGFGLIAGAIFFLVISTAVFLNLPTKFTSDVFNEHWTFSQLMDLFLSLFESDFSAALFQIGALLMLLVPISGILIGGIKLLFGFKSNTKLVGTVLGSTFLLGFLMFCFSSIQLWKDNFEKSKDVITVQNFEFENLHLAAGNDIFNCHDNKSSHGMSPLLIQFEKDQIHLGHPEIFIKKSNTGYNYFEVVKSSRGNNHNKALELANDIEYNYQIQDSALFFDAFFTILKSDGYKIQDVNVNLYLKEGQRIELDRNLNRMMYDVPNVHSVLDSKMWGREWIMTHRGLDLYYGPESTDHDVMLDED